MQVAELQRTEADARAAFQRALARNPLSPWGLLRDPTRHSVRLCYVPFWAFRVAGTATYSGDVSYEAPGGAHLEWQRKDGPARLPVETALDDAHTQVAACYHLGQDLLHGMRAGVEERGARFVARRLPLSEHDVRAHAAVPAAAAGAVHVLPVEMHRAVAWQLASRRLRRSLVRRNRKRVAYAFAAQRVQPSRS